MERAANAAFACMHQPFLVIVPFMLEPLSAGTLLGELCRIWVFWGELPSLGRLPVGRSACEAGRPPHEPWRGVAWRCDVRRVVGDGSRNVHLRSWGV